MPYNPVQECTLTVPDRFTSQHPSLLSAQQWFDTLRDHSGEGGSTWPLATLYLHESKATLTVSYNGRLWEIISHHRKQMIDPITGVERPETVQWL